MTPGMQLVLTLLTAMAGAAIARRLGLAAPGMIGSMLGVGIMNLLFGYAYMPAWVRVIAQGVSGSFIAMNITRDDILHLRRLIGPYLLLIGMCTLNTVVMGIFLSRLCGLGLMTSLFGSVAGGVADVTLIAGDYDADVGIVALMQTSRLVMVLLVFPFWVKLNVRRAERRAATTGVAGLDASDGQVAARGAVALEAAAVDDVDLGEVARDASGGFGRRATAARDASAGAGGQVPSAEASGAARARQMLGVRLRGRGLRKVLFTGVVGIALSFAGRVSGVPAGGMLFPLVGIAVLNLRFNAVAMPRKVKNVAQLLAGSLVGESITVSTFSSLNTTLLPVALLIASYMLVNFVYSRIVARKGMLDLKSALFVSAPGGASDMALIAADLDADLAKIAVIQAMRAAYAVAIMPSVCLLVAHLLS